MIIDAHQHVFWHGQDDKGLIADMNEHRIDQAWLLTWEIPPNEDWQPRHVNLNPIHARDDGTHAGIPLSDAITVRNRYPNRFILGYCPSPLKGNAADLFEAAYRMHGVRVCGEWKYRILIDDPRCLELFHKAGELNCPVILHMDVPYLFNKKLCKQSYYPNWYGGTLENLERVLKACPETNFLGHAPGFWRELGGDADINPDIYPSTPFEKEGQLSELLDKYHNLYADMSAGSAIIALQRNSEYTREFLCRHANKVVFGRDCYGKDLYNFIETLDLSKEVLDKIYFKNAMQLLAI